MKVIVTIEDFAAFCRDTWARCDRGGVRAAHAIEGWFEDAERIDPDAAAQVERDARAAGLLP